MRNSNLFYVSSLENPSFPLELWKHPKVSIQVKTFAPKESPHLALSSEDINLFFLQLHRSDWDQISASFLKDYEVHPYVSTIFIHFLSGEKDSNLENKAKFLVLESPLRNSEFRFMLDRTIQFEFYKHSCLEIAANSMSNVGLIDGVFDLARKEQTDLKQTNEAWVSLFSYEERIKKTNDQINKALEKVYALKDQEMLELLERIKAQENLDILRDKERKEANETRSAQENLQLLREQELKDAISTQKAQEKAMQYSRIEEMNLDKIIQAQDRLFAYTEHEIKTLRDENEELKRKLGISKAEK